MLKVTAVQCDVSADCSMLKSPWYNRTSWLGVKHQLTYSMLKVTAVQCGMSDDCVPCWRYGCAVWCVNDCVPCWRYRCAVLCVNDCVPCWRYSCAVWCVNDCVPCWRYGCAVLCVNDCVPCWRYGCAAWCVSWLCHCCLLLAPLHWTSVLCCHSSLHTCGSITTAHRWSPHRYARCLLFCHTCGSITDCCFVTPMAAWQIVVLSHLWQYHRLLVCHTCGSITDCFVTHVAVSQIVGLSHLWQYHRLFCHTCGSITDCCFVTPVAASPLLTAGPLTGKQGVRLLFDIWCIQGFSWANFR